MSDGPLFIRSARSGGSPSVYHSDPECTRIGEDAREVDRDHVEWRDLRECRVCAGEWDTDRSEMYRPLRTRIEQGEVEV